MNKEAAMDICQKRAKILLVDDEYFNFELLKGVIPERFQLEYLASGQLCLGQIVTDHPDLILLDVCMPGLDGYDTCRMIKNTPETQDIPVLMLTGLESDRDKKAGFDAGCDDYIVKPYSLPQLIEKISHYVAK
ncbi:response regulator [Pseudoalteromonas tunicata]|uniref:Putative two-component response regulator n=1 Tax=Pseudoalteromonas tunicata D2 TaxID=87626 RepID=A4CBF7_9GAMM|nr:response regulator [Pseudoalteromonas tunicata]EAR27694.1 Putative two-component response regulator [Pseudoalteromonas tunicata D2]MDP4985398.1 response regulator [Pseudoalteromonas tunicata]MDP5211475.1 response regulator [Pseudoalteromonas tunicata]